MEKLSFAKTETLEPGKRDVTKKDSTKTEKTTENIIISQKEDIIKVGEKIPDRVKDIMNQEEKLLSDMAKKDVAEEPVTEIMDHKKFVEEQRRRDSELYEGVSEGLIKISQKAESEKGK